MTFYVEILHIFSYCISRVQSEQNQLEIWGFVPFGGLVKPP